MNVIHYILFVLFFLTIYSIYFKTIEGFDDDFYYYDKLIEYKSMPNSYVNDSIPSRTINKFGFYKGKGTFKKGYTDETKSDEKISTLNKLLNRLLGRIVSDNQDCVGSFGKYSECDKSCGSNSYQTRTYNITTERGKNGMDCPLVDGYEEKIRCDLDECQLGDLCKNNNDCGTGNCDPNSTRCENMVPCDSKNFHVCNETDCINLNDNNNNNNDNKDRKMIEGTYIYNNVDKECFFKTPAEIEKLNLNVYTYDFRTISENVKNFVLECEYYQVKKDGVGPCINAPNIIMEGEGDTKYPKCSPGYGPEPTIFNGLNACQKCIINPDERVQGNGDGDGDGDGDNECLCKDGGIFSNGNCSGTVTTTSTNNLCPSGTDPLWFVKRQGDDGGCELCPPEFQFRKNNSTGSCVLCPVDGDQPGNTFSNYCDFHDLDDLDDGVCNIENFKNNYLENIDGSGSINLETDDYYEKCISGLETELSSVCGGDQNQTRIGNDCKCTGQNMNFGDPRGGDGVCSQANCLEGFTFSDDGCVPNNCRDALHCRDGAEDDDCVEGEPKSCLSCELGYELSVAVGDSGRHCDSCLPGYETRGIYGDNLTCTCSSAPNCQSEDSACVTYEGKQVKRCETCNTGYTRMGGVCGSCANGYHDQSAGRRPAGVDLTCVPCTPSPTCLTPVSVPERTCAEGLGILTCAECRPGFDLGRDGICKQHQSSPTPPPAPPAPPPPCTGQSLVFPTTSYVADRAVQWCSHLGTSRPFTSSEQCGSYYGYVDDSTTQTYQCSEISPHVPDGAICEARAACSVE